MVLAALPEASATRKLKNISLAVDGKVFAFTGSKGRLVMKLPQDRIHQLLAVGEVAPLVMGKRTMREWVVAPPAGPGEEIKRLQEALAYVKSLPRRK